MEGMRSDGEEDPPSSSLSAITMSGEKTGLIVMIPHVDNGGYSKEGRILGLGQAVGTDIGIVQGWKQRGHRWSHSHRLGVVQCVCVRGVHVQTDISVAAIIGCRCLDVSVSILALPSRS